MKLLVCMMALMTAIPGASADSPRVVCLGGVVTEIVWALGAGSMVVAVDDSSIYPEDAAARPKVGYFRMISAEGVLSLRPDLIVAHEHAGPPEALSQLERAGVKLIRVTAANSIAGCLQRIREIGGAIGRPEVAEVLGKHVALNLAAWSDTPPGPAPRVLFVFAHGAGALNVAGTDTAADEIIRLAGGRNTMTGFRGYRPLTAEAIVEADPEVVLLTTGSLGGLGGIEAVWQVPGMKATSAFTHRRVAAMDDLLLLGFGPRLPDALRELSGLLFP
ncbi:MAG TPA: ABC transporter substrate-binding protein [Kiritimatiellia bacterium]|nr:ABC transporter substrate-binding protein [Kiritimatiellia bacterium]